MSYKISHKSIFLTRGDSFKAKITMRSQDGSEHMPEEGDRIRFAMKKHYDDPEPVILKDIPIDTMELELEPSDTKELEFGKYVYDVELTTGAGYVDTFITKGLFVLTEEVH